MKASPATRPAPPEQQAPRRALVLALWALALLAAVAQIARTEFTADLSAFLPRSPDAGQRMLIEQVASGTPARTLLIGIEGGGAGERAQASRELAAALRASGRFAQVANGEHDAFAEVGHWLFEHRYALSPAVTPERFTAAGLRDAIADQLALLGTPAGASVKATLEQDPSGETMRIAEALLAPGGPRLEDGVWVARDGERALLLALTRAAGGDLDAQQAAIATARAAFAPAAARGLTLQLSGAPRFAVDSRARIESEVRFLAIAGALLMSALLLFAFASPAALAVALLPVGTGVVVGIAAVGLGFGSVHGMTLGFGATLIGESVDYAIYYLIQARGAARADRMVSAARVDGMVSAARAAEKDGAAGAAGMDPAAGSDGMASAARAAEKDGAADAAGMDPAAGSDAMAGQRDHAPGEGWRRWLTEGWPTIRLGLLTSVCGFGALVFSGFPGLAQLGVFSIAGLLGAALATRFVLPVLRPDGAGASGMRAYLGRFAARSVHALPRARWPLLALGVAAAVLVIAHGDPWRAELAALSPIPKAALELDQRLRADLSGGDARPLVVVQGPDLETVLQRAEAAARRLDALVEAGSLGGYDSITRFLPSQATQQARRAALPEATALRTALAQATAGGPLTAARLEPFVDAVQFARVAPTLTLATLRDAPAAPLVESLLLERADGGVSALLPLQGAITPDGRPGAIDAATVRSALAGLPDTQWLDLASELRRLYRHYLDEAQGQALLGALGIVLLMAFALRSPARLLAVCQPLALAVLLTLGGLTLAGVEMGILHLVGLLLVVAVGSNYALFFDLLASDPGRDAAPDTLASLLLANLTTVASFGLLAWSEIPALSAIGRVVAPGALLALVLAAAFAPSRDRARSQRGL